MKKYLLLIVSSILLFSCVNNECSSRNEFSSDQISESVVSLNESESHFDSQESSEEQSLDSEYNSITHASGPSDEDSYIWGELV